jgi:hypothetical protein
MLRDPPRSLTTIPRTMKRLLPLLPAILSAAASAQLVVPSGTTPTIQSAINAAAPSNTITVLPGTYTENLNFQGKAITLQSLSGPAVTILDGGGTAPVVTMSTGEARTTVLAGFTIRNGANLSSSPIGNGGGIVLNGTSPTIRDCWITKNSCFGYGGGICGQPAGSSGSSPLIEDCRFVGNGVTSTGLGSGGALAFINGSTAAANVPEIRRCLFRDNVVPTRGGGFYCAYYCNAVIEDCFFTGNSTTAAGAATSLSGGAAIFISLVSNITVKNCVIAGNTTSSTSGAVKTFNIPGSTFVNCTIVNNAKGSVGCISSAAVGGTNNTLDFVNCILWGNGTTEVTSVTSGSTVPVVNINYSTVSGGYAGTSNLSVDPKLANVMSGNARLLPGSPCIDAGDSAHAALPLKDFEGDPRQVGAAVDIGADERVPTSVLVYADRESIPVSSPGTTTITIEAGAARAGQIYAVLAGLSGTTPGLDLFGMHLPLNLDAMTNFGLSVFPTFAGALDATGHAAATMPLGTAPLTPYLAGQVLSFSAATMTLSAITAFANADNVRLVP